MLSSSPPAYPPFLTTPKNAARRTRTRAHSPLLPLATQDSFSRRLIIFRAIFSFRRFAPFSISAAGIVERERAREGRPNISATPLSNSATHKLEKHTRTGSSRILVLIEAWKVQAWSCFVCILYGGGRTPYHLFFLGREGLMF